MKLYVTRHGAAEDASASPNDFDRALTMKGRKRTIEVGRKLASDKELPDIIVSSPLVRAVQTAEILASVLEPAEAVVVRQDLAPGNSPLALFHEFGKRTPRAVMLVGHEPGLSELMISLLGEAAWPKGFTKSMVASLKLDESGVAKLRWVLDPKTLHLTNHR